MYINVRDCGAAGDGIRDDTAAIQAALDAAAREGSTVYLPGGAYRVRTLHVPGHITVMANASWGYNLGTRPKPLYTDDDGYRGNAYLCPMEDEGAVLDLTGAYGVRLVGISLEGEKRGESLCAIRAGEGAGYRNLVLDDVRVSGFTGDAVDLTGVEGFAVRRSLFIQNIGHAINAAGAKNGSVIDGQLSFNTKGAGLYAVGAENITVIGCRIEGGHPGGGYCENARGLTFAGNSFDFCNGPGLTFLECEGCSATGNMFRCSGRGCSGDEWTHIRAERSGGLAIMGNTMWAYCPLSGGEYTETGMILSGLADSIVQGNALFNSCGKNPVDDRGGHRNTIIDDNPGCPPQDDPYMK